MLSEDRKRAIHLEARAAALRGESLNHACPYPFAHPDGRWFKRLFKRWHSISSLMASDPAGALLSSAGSVEEAPAAVSHNVSRSL
jgi:hypothetical protein